jgi:hypothetical protein
MKKKLIKRNIEIAISMLGEVRTDRYGSRKIKHSERNFVTQTVTELLQEILNPNGNTTGSIISKNQHDFNPPEES